MISTKLKIHVASLCVVFVLGSTVFCAGQREDHVPVFKITSGLVSHQVLQRDATDRADLDVTGKVTYTGATSIQIRVLRRHIVVEGFEWAGAGDVKDNVWKANVKGLPVGGPYDVQVRVLQAEKTLASASVHDILVGDIWVLAGQSNMVGNGRLVDLETPHELVHNFNPRDEWEVAEEPLHSLAESIDEVHWGDAGHLEPLWAKPGQKATGPLEGEDRARFRRNRQHGTGLALTFAKEMVQHTGVPIGLIPCAHGGTSIGQWDPALKSAGRRSLYGAMVERVEAVGGRIKGVLWHQGEADMDHGSAAQYAERFRNLIEQVRVDFRQPDLPFYYFQISRFVTKDPLAWNQIQEVQRMAELSIPNVGMVVSVDQPLDDIIHVSGDGLKVMGQRLSKRVGHDLFASVKAYRDLKTGPRPVRAYTKVHHGKLDPWSGDRRTVYVEFSGVNGTLTSLGRAAGFSLRQPDGTEVVGIFRTLVDAEMPNRVLLEFGLGIPNRPLPADTQLWYGWGLNPYCNLTDEENLAVPVFGPMEIEGVATDPE